MFVFRISAGHSASAGAGHMLMRLICLSLWQSDIPLWLIISPVISCSHDIYVAPRVMSGGEQGRLQGVLTVIQYSSPSARWYSFVWWLGLSRAGLTSNSPIVTIMRCLQKAFQIFCDIRIEGLSYSVWWNSESSFSLVLLRNFEHW